MLGLSAGRWVRYLSNFPVYQLSPLGCVCYLSISSAICLFSLNNQEYNGTDVSSKIVLSGGMILKKNQVINLDTSGLSQFATELN